MLDNRDDRNGSDRSLDDGDDRKEFLCVCKDDGRNERTGMSMIMVMEGSESKHEQGCMMIGMKRCFFYTRGP